MVSIMSGDVSPICRPVEMFLIIQSPQQTCTMLLMTFAGEFCTFDT